MRSAFAHGHRPEQPPIAAPGHSHGGASGVMTQTALARSADIEVVAADAALGAEVRGVDLSRPLPREVLDRVRRAWLDHVVLLFRGQMLSDENLIAFGRQFGELHRTEGLAYGDKPRGTAPEIEVI